MSVAVRRARPKDARRIAQILVETWQATYVGVVPQDVLDALDVQARERTWKQYIASRDFAVFVAGADDEIVGFVSVGPSRERPGIGQLYTIYVTPGAQGTGAGLALMEAGVAWLAERWDEATLWVATENPRARRFYERFGWVAADERVDEALPGALVPETRYRLSGLSRL